MDKKKHRTAKRIVKSTVRRKQIASKALGIALACLMVGTMFGALPSIARAAGNFNIGDTVEVQNTGSIGLKVRDSPAGNQIGGEYDGDRGLILEGPQSAALGGITYTWWRIRWEDGLVGWSAEGYPGGVYYLKKVLQGNPPPSISSISPSEPTTSSSQQKIDIYGSNFQYGASLGLWNPNGTLVSGHSEYFVDSTHIYFYATLSVAGYWKVQVINPDGQKSSQYSFYVKAPTTEISTTLSISPSSFTLQSGKSTTLTATLKDGSNNPLANKTIGWSAAADNLSAASGTTNSYGQVSVTYTAPTVTAQTSATITASFAGDASYQASSGTSLGTITVAAGPEPDIRAPVSSILFGNVAVGDSLNKTTTIYNDGNAILTINGVTRTSGSSDFTYIGPSTPFSIGAGSSREMTIRFTPSSVGSKSATFTVNSNDPDEANVAFSVSGSGITGNPPTAYIDSISPNPATQGIDTVSFVGHGTDPDGYVVAYEWSSSLDGQLSTSSSFSRPASELSPGTHTIYFKVKDDDGLWSAEVTDTLIIIQSEALQTGTIEVTSYPSGAPFNLSGPATYSGTTPWSISDAPVGTYTITWGSMSGYDAPPPESKPLVESGTISFDGLYSPISPQVLPDLTVTSVSAPPSATVGESISVTFTVKNVGDAPSETFTYKIFLAVEPYIGTSAYYQMGETFSMSPLATDESKSDTKDVTIPSANPRDYYVAVYVDPYPGAIDEEDEGNNIGSTLISIVEGNQPPIAYASASYVEVSSGDFVHFDGSGSEDPEGGELSYYWDFGDGENAENEKVTHRFRGAMNQSKTYTVTLTVEDDKGSIDNDTISVIVNHIENTVEVSGRYAIPIPIFGGIAIPYLPEFFVRMTASYNWVDYKDGDDIYIISKITSEAQGLVGLYWLMIVDTDDWILPAIMWADAARTFGLHSTKTYDSSDNFAVTPLLGIKNTEITLMSFPEDALAPIEIFEGIRVDWDDVMATWGVATAVSPLFVIDIESTAFYPDAPTVAGDPRLKWALDFLVGRLKSPGELRVYDSQGRVTGLVNGEVIEEIPFSIYDAENKTIMVFRPSNPSSYHYEVAGTDEGTYRLIVGSVENGEFSTLDLTNVPTSAKAVHEYTFDWDVLSGGEEGITMRIDSDGDGTFENTFNLLVMEETPIPSVRIIMPDLVIVETPQNLPEFVRIAERFEVRLMNVVPETPFELGIENSKFTRVWIDLKEARENVTMTIEKLEEKPPELPDPPGLVWAYHRIEVNVPEDAIENAEIDFWIPKEWLATHGVSKEDIRLFRFGEGWEELTTEIVGENTAHVSYRAGTPGFSVFAITAYAPPAEVLPLEINMMLVGALVTVAIALMIAFVVGHRMRGGKRPKRTNKVAGLHQKRHLSSNPKPTEEVSEFL